MVKKTWLRADFRMPSTYSIRVPLSSDAAALAMPAPGPATVRSALTKKSLEFNGLDVTRNELFPVICDADVCVKPPDRVGISNQRLRMYKVIAKNSSSTKITQSLGYREVCHAFEDLTVFIKIPAENEECFRRLLHGIGYWGQGNSFTTCTRITTQEPKNGECAIPLSSFKPDGQQLHPYFICVATEFRPGPIAWSEIDPFGTGAKSEAIQPQIFVWPLTLIEQRSEHKLYHYCSLDC